MFLNYFALGVLIFVFLVIFYGIIIIHDIPYLIAKKRNHPHSDAIHVAGQRLSDLEHQGAAIQRPQSTSAAEK